MEDSNKILHVADLHGVESQYEWLETEACKTQYDAVVLAGDLCDSFRLEGLNRQIDQISSTLIKISEHTPVLVCSGNHDSDPAIPELINATWIQRLKGNNLHTDGDTLKLSGRRIFINGWAQTTLPAGPIDIVVTHAPPSGCDCSDQDGSDFGDSLLWPSLQECRPSLILCGHVHRPWRHSCSIPYARPSCSVLVPGCDQTPEIPAHWIINFSSGIAIHSDGETRSFRGKPDLLPRKKSPTF